MSYGAGGTIGKIDPSAAGTMYIHNPCPVDTLSPARTSTNLRLVVSYL